MKMHKPAAKPFDPLQMEKTNWTDIRKIGVKMVQMNSIPEKTLEYYKKLTSIPLSLNNARQLGGLPLKDGKKVKDGVFLRTTQLYDTTPEDIETLRQKYNLKIIFDMRGDDEIKRFPDPEIEGVKWLHIPIIDFHTMRENIVAKFQGHEADIPKIDPSNQEEVINFLILLMLKDLETGDHKGSLAYAEYLQGKTGQESFGTFFHEIAALQEGSVLWHCFTGKDRTGIASGLLLDILGADWNTIVTDYEISNLYFKEKITETENMLRAKGIAENIIARMCGSLAGVHITLMEEAWKCLKDVWGGAEGYLIHACGVSAEELDDIRKRYAVKDSQHI